MSPGETDLCLLTGASGFIGGHLAERLVADQRRVRCLVRPTSDTTRLAQLGVELVHGDLTDPGSLTRAVQGCRHVVHCAALVSDWATVREIKQVNVVGTRELAAAAAAAAVERFVHLSSTDVYGYPGAREVDESRTPHGFSNWYAQTKWEAEQELQRAAQTGELELVLLRPASVYGPGSREVVAEMARAIRAGHMIRIGGGDVVAGLVYVENLADAVLLALDNPAAVGRAFNITDGLSTTWRTFLDDLADGLDAHRVRWNLPYRVASALAFSLENGYRLLRRATGLQTPALLSRQAVHVLGRPQDFSNRRAREVLGWAPRVDYPTGLAATLAWLRNEYFAA